MLFTKISYTSLNSKQQENYNFHKIAALLADYGFTSIRLSDDWQGADFIAQHIDGNTFLKIQLKGRLTIEKKYQGKDIFIAFPYESFWYLYPHDEVVRYLLATSTIGKTTSWTEKGGYSINSLSRSLLDYIQRYKL